MTKHQKNVEDFMKLAGQRVPERATIPSRETRYLRAKLILEETIECIEALGFSLEVEKNVSVSEENFNQAVKLVPKTDDINVPNVLKELADISVVGPAGTSAAFGIDIEPILELVDQNNLGKFGPGSYKNEYGKHCKPPGYPKPEPEIEKEISRQTDLFRKRNKVDHHSV